MRRRGYTLIELALSTGITAVLLLACSSAVLIAARAVDHGGGPASRLAQAHRAITQITDDLAVALDVTERSATAIAFTVPDRDGDGAVESIRYAWTGLPGGSLVRWYNGAASVLADNVHDLDLTYLVTTRTPPPPVESPEQLLISHDDAPGGSMKNFDLTTAKWCGQYFQPSLPANAVSWKITRVKISAKRDTSPSGMLQLQIRTANSNKQPGDVVLGSVDQSPSLLPSAFGWMDVVFPSPVSGLDPTVGVSLVIAESVSGNTGRIEYESGGSPMTPNTHWVTTSNSGQTWTTPDNTNDMRFYVYGTITTRQP